MNPLFGKSVWGDDCKLSNLGMEAAELPLLLLALDMFLYFQYLTISTSHNGETMLMKSWQCNGVSPSSTVAATTCGVSEMCLKSVPGTK